VGCLHCLLCYSKAVAFYTVSKQPHLYPWIFHLWWVLFFFTLFIAQLKLERKGGERWDDMQQRATGWIWTQTIEVRTQHGTWGACSIRRSTRAPPSMVFNPKCFHTSLLRWFGIVIICSAMFVSFFHFALAKKNNNSLFHWEEEGCNGSDRPTEHFRKSQMCYYMRIHFLQLLLSVLFLISFCNCLRQLLMRNKAWWGKGGWWMADSVGFTGARLNVSLGLGVNSALERPCFHSPVRRDWKPLSVWVWDDETHTLPCNTHTMSLTHPFAVPVCLAFLFPSLYSARANCFGPEAGRGWPPLAFCHAVRQLRPYKDQDGNCLYSPLYPSLLVYFSCTH